MGADQIIFRKQYELGPVTVEIVQLPLRISMKSEYAGSLKFGYPQIMNLIILNTIFPM